MMASDEEAGHPDFSEEEIRQHKEPISNGGDIERYCAPPFWV